MAFCGLESSGSTNIRVEEDLSLPIDQPLLGIRRIFMDSSQYCAYANSVRIPDRHYFWHLT